MFGEKMHWKDWHAICHWAASHGFKNLAARMELNDRYWMFSGEFGRSQVEICDMLRFAEDETEALSLASDMDMQLADMYGIMDEDAPNGQLQGGMILY